MGDQLEKSWKFQGGERSDTKPSGMENPVGEGSNWKKKTSRGGMDTFWNHPIEDRRKNGREGTVIREAT